MSPEEFDKRRKQYLSDFKAQYNDEFHKRLNELKDQIRNSESLSDKLLDNFKMNDLFLEFESTKNNYILKRFFTEND